MKYIKLFEDFNEFDPFGEEKEYETQLKKIIRKIKSGEYNIEMSNIGQLYIDMGNHNFLNIIPWKQIGYDVPGWVIWNETKEEISEEDVDFLKSFCIPKHYKK